MKNKTAKILIVILIICLILFGITRCVKKTMDSLDNKLSDDNGAMIYKVAKQDLSDYINSTGTLSSDALVSISSNLSGCTISNLYVEVGDTVSEGQRIATVDVSELRSTLNDLRQSKSKVESGLKKVYEEAVSSRDEVVGEAEETYNSALESYNTYKVACDSDPSSCDNDELSELLLAKNSAEKSLNKVKKEYNALVSEAKEKMDEPSEFDSEIKELQSKINGATIVAPSSGLITSLNVNKGGIISTSEIGVIQNSDEYKVSVSIGEASILKIKPGMKATVRVVATGNKEYNATVTKVNKLPSTAYGDLDVIGYKAVVRIDDKNTELLMGMSAKVKIYLSNQEARLAVPYDAIHIDKINGTYVYVIKKPYADSAFYELTYKKIEVGFEGNYYTEVLSGLSEDELVYVSTNDLPEYTQFSIGEIENTTYYIGGRNA